MKPGLLHCLGNLSRSGVACFFGILVAFHFFCADPVHASPTDKTDFLLGGIQVNEDNHERWVRSLRDHGFNTVAVTVYAHQGDWDSANLWHEPTNESVINEIRVAKEKGLSVVLIMRVALDHAFPRNRFLWHGMIMPEDDKSLSEWFRRYEHFVLSWARIAEAEGVDIFGLGSEMRSLTATTKTEAIPALEEYYLNDQKQERAIRDLLNQKKRPQKLSDWFHDAEDSPSLEAYLRERRDVWKSWATRVSFQNSAQPIQKINERRQTLLRHWKQLINNTRSIFSGRITYAANFDEFEEVAFWSALDIMGVNAYFILRDEKIPLENKVALQKALERGWKRAFSRMEQVQKSQDLSNQPVLFTELGYTFRQNATLGPWASSGIHDLGQDFIVWKEEPFAFSERTYALKALRSVYPNESPELTGILYWKLSTKSEHWDIEPFVHVIGDKKDSAFGKALKSFTQPAKAHSFHALSK